MFWRPNVVSRVTTIMPRPVEPDPDTPEPSPQPPPEPVDPPVEEPHHAPPATALEGGRRRVRLILH